MTGERDGRRGGRDVAVPAGVFLLSLLLCISFARFAKPLPVTDEFLTYYRIAGHVADGSGFSEDGSRPYVYLPPLFSTLLGGWFALTGSRSLFAVQVFQSLCIAASAFLTFRLAQRVFPRSGRAALLPALCIAVHPSLWTYAVFVRQEPTILLVTTLASWTTAAWLGEPGRLRGALAGACWGAATLAKTVTLFVPLLLLFVWGWRGRRERRVGGGEIALALLAFILVVAPWTARNYRLFHRLIPVNDQAAGMLEWNVRRSDAPADEGKGVASLLITQLATKDAATTELAGEKFIAQLDREGVTGSARTARLWSYVLSHKRYFLVQRVRHAIFFAAPAVDWWIQSGRLKTGAAQRSATFLATAVLFHGIFYLFFLGRLLRLVRGNAGLAETFLVLFVGCYWGTYALLWGEPRFAIPVYPLLILFAPWELLAARNGTVKFAGSTIDTRRS